MPEVATPNAPPYSAVALLRMVLSNGDAGWGTGAVIDATHVLTCAHNLISRRGQYEARAIEVFPGYSGAQAPAPGSGVAASRGFYQRAFVYAQDRTWDIGVIELKHAVRMSVYMQPNAVTEQQDPPKELDIAGYPSSRHFRMWTDRELWSGINVQEHVFAYTHDTEAGSSGSPIYSWERRAEIARLYGVHSGLAQNREDKVGVLVTRVTHAFIEEAAHAAPPPGSPFLLALGPRAGDEAA
ncbi:MAG TPA: trypsin-like peptidase domain-containing protein [Solirubrobacteraceae bacterium]|nr:trypsin-like peptidase domain-containing protein [Solirubrobacteraceae bacterium]